MTLLRHFSVTGLLVGTLFFAFSLTPSLLPRPWLVQGVISGLSFAAGYGLGVGGHWLWRYLELPEPGPYLLERIKLVASVFCLLTAGVFLWRASGWQASLHTLMGMEPVGGIRPISVALVAALVFIAVLLLGRLFRRTFRALSWRLRGHVPRRVSHLLSLVAAIVMFWAVIDGVIFALTLRALDNSYQQVDRLMPDDLTPPEDPQLTGSDASLISWEGLGLRGRRFVAATPSADQLSELIGTPARRPIRVYVGLNAAETPKERAELALAELIRLGGFERSLLLLATPTGRGWLDPGAQHTLEALHRGDVATVTAQYSYLPSPLALLTEGQYGVEMARALFQAVYGHWSALPEAERPALYLHGLSLGALNSDSAFDLYDIIDAPFQGALWSGPPFRSETWRSVTAERDPGSPAWLPRFRDGRVVRFMNQETGLTDQDGDWGDFRIAYLQYASDPVTFFEPRSLFREPDWMREPRGPDVSPELRWYPVVTMLQLLADLATGSAPPGYGHEIAAEHYFDAWVALTDPEGWSEAELERLKAHFRSPASE
ncbi:alpha/beta-hydrolase family protein [Halomonas sp. BM-2019]|uniref:alpha/beta hydrolase n=1 Tax=Halomonas sp. BM-2019 TaxID=2811227 RepID=UPI001B3C32E6|nr:MAG: alpha/beta-hydrolase family protein [Halomonas sp. BM-2019]